MMKQPKGRVRNGPAFMHFTCKSSDGVVMMEQRVVGVVRKKDFFEARYRLGRNFLPEVVGDGFSSNL